MLVRTGDHLWTVVTSDEKPATYRPPSSAKELLERYRAGERDFRGAELPGANLGKTELPGIDLSGADLTRANLFAADLSHAIFTDTCFRAANLSTCVLSGAAMRRAKLFDANLFDATLEGVDLRGANLYGADLTRVRLQGATVDAVRLGSTNLLEMDLSTLCDEHHKLRYDGPSRVDFLSISISVHSPKLKSFLARIGVPAVFVEYMVDCALSLKTDVFKMLQSTFISYGGPDQAFARKLYEALHRNGVTTFFFPEHAEPGEKLHRTMRKGVNEHDRVILICSRHSLDRTGVLNELEEILTREARDGGESYLIPIRLDEYVFDGWKPSRSDLAQALRDRVVVDFAGADTDEVKFQAGVQKLIRALRKKRVEAGEKGA